MSVRIEQATAIAQLWVEREAAQLPGFQGAILHGSANWLPDKALLPPDSDLDVMVVLTDETGAPKPGKFRYDGVLLEVSFLPAQAVASAEQILASSHLAGSFRRPGILADPTGRLAELQRQVGREYARRTWVERRCQDAMEKIERGLRTADDAPLPELVNSWLFPAGITTHVLLLAGLQNPTVRTRYVAVRDLLAAYGLSEVYPQLLDLLGAREITPLQASHHLAALAMAFDAASQVIRSPLFFAADLTPEARGIPIDGSAAMIARGDHREAMFWIAATSTRCQQVFRSDAPELVAEHEPLYLDLLANLGVAGAAELELRKQEIERALPRIWETALAIIAANPGISD